MKKACLRIGAMVFVLACSSLATAGPNCTQYCSLVPCPDADVTYCDGVSCHDLGICFPIEW
jgi:hypothetical protein